MNLFFDVPADAVVFFYIAIAALIFAIVFIAFLFGSRFFKSKSIRKESQLRDRFQKSLNVILQMDSLSNEPGASHQFYYAQLMADMGNSRLAKQVMTDQLIGLRKNLSGSSAQSLENIYLRLGLDKFSLQKLGSSQWHIIAQGIVELSQMNVEGAVQKISAQLQSKNATVREEALVGLVKLDPTKSLDFLNDYSAPLSSWLVMRIHQQLTLSDKRTLTDFSRWYHHPNLDVALFAIEMTKQFRQINYATKLTNLFHDPESRKVMLAIDTCGELQLHDVADELMSVSEKYWNDDLISLSLVKSLGKTAYKEEHWQRLVNYLNHSNYSVRLESARTLFIAGEQTGALLRKAGDASPGLLRAISSHVQDPLLQH